MPSMDLFSSLTSSSALSPNILHKISFKFTGFKAKTLHQEMTTYGRHIVCSSFQFPNDHVHDHLYDVHKPPHKPSKPSTVESLLGKLV